MDYQKVIIDTWEFVINPASWTESYEDLRTYKRTINGNLKQIGGVKKKVFSFEGANYSYDSSNSDVKAIEDYFTTGGQYSLTTPAGEVYTVIITSFEKTYEERRTIKYRVEAREA